MATTAAFPETQPLPASTDTRICIVGAGIAGLTTAYLLARDGIPVMVLDDGPIGGGETERTTAHLVSAMDDRFYELERMHGREGSRLTYLSHARAIDTIEAICREEKIDCEFQRVDGYLMLSPDGERTELEHELAAAERTGIDVELLPAGPVQLYPGLPCLRFGNQAQFHPMRYLAGLARAIVARGGRIHSHTKVTSVDDGRPVVLKTESGHTVTCNAVVIATNSPFVDRVAMHTKQHAYRTYAIACRVDPGSVPRALYWETADPYHYVRLAHHDSVLIVGGEDHKTGQDPHPEERWTALEAWTRARFPVHETLERWSGQVLEPVDSLGYSGRNPGDDHVYVITGDSGQGLTNGTVGALLVSDLLMGRKNPWQTLYDPSRKSLKQLGEYLRENLNVAKQYGYWLHPSEASSEDEIVSGQGAVLMQGGTPVAVFRDAFGTLHRMSAICTHLAGIVRFNPAEQTWDCPCHGSRFDCFGRVVNGPAVRDLKPLAPKRKPTSRRSRPSLRTAGESRAALRGRLPARRKR